MGRLFYLHRNYKKVLQCSTNVVQWNSKTTKGTVNMEQRTAFTYETVRAGQPRAYADSFYEYRITLVAMPYADNQTSVKTIAHLLRGRSEGGIADSSAEAGFCQPYFTKVEKDGDVWHVAITEPFTD